MHFFCSQQSFFRLSNISPSIIAILVFAGGMDISVFAVCVDILVSSECVSISSWLCAWTSSSRPYASPFRLGWGRGCLARASRRGLDARRRLKNENTNSLILKFLTKKLQRLPSNCFFEHCSKIIMSIKKTIRENSFRLVFEKNHVNLKVFQDFVW